MYRDFGKLQIGQEIWVKIEDYSNAAKHIGDNIEERAFKGEITKVGRKYISVKFFKPNGVYLEEKFKIDDDYKQVWICGGADYKLYLTKQDIFDEIEMDKLHSNIKSEFNSFNNNNKFTLDQLQRIIEIIKE